MRKFFYVLGIIFAVLIVAAGVGMFFVVKSTSAVDAEGKAYVDTALTAILPNWSSAELLNRASPEFKRVTSPDDLAAFLDAAKAALGGLTEYQGAKSQGATVSTTVQSGNVATAKYVAQAEFQKGSAAITVTVRKINGNWIIDGFNVGSSELLHHLTGKPS